ncbi:hypothetical protein BHE74_00010231 [Ensete ventricosum]|uniref:Uncharacterized protein n=1 Tax=Ensete ventricosum TaxID=4639 RepID=A0A427AYE7_ENSVE|nr:hypothetical protein B296_00022337 [Ensete ventricosum]RWW81389.1 hypothetical protein BHE74_00010231 [Ensete ventricosum]
MVLINGDISVAEIDHPPCRTQDDQINHAVFRPAKSHVLYETGKLGRTEARAVNYVEAKAEGMMHAEPTPTPTTRRWWGPFLPLGRKKKDGNGSNADTGNSVLVPDHVDREASVPLERRTRDP